MQKANTHENNKSHGEEALPPSDRNLAVTFTAVFAVIAFLPLVHAGSIRLWSLGVAAVILAVGFTAPQLLRPFNLLWFKFGLLLHLIVNPIVLGVLFFVGVTPMALLIRLSGKRLMPLYFDTQASSYWIKRQPPGPSPESVHRQF